MFPISRDRIEAAYRKLGARVLVGEWFTTEHTQTPGRVKKLFCGCPLVVVAIAEHARDDCWFADARKLAVGPTKQKIADALGLTYGQVNWFTAGFDGWHGTRPKDPEGREALNAGRAARRAFLGRDFHTETTHGPP